MTSLQTIAALFELLGLLAKYALIAYAIRSCRELLIHYVDKGNAILPEFRTPEEVSIDKERSKT